MSILFEANGRLLFIILGSLAVACMILIILFTWLNHRKPKKSKKKTKTETTIEPNVETEPINIEATTSQEPLKPVIEAVDVASDTIVAIDTNAPTTEPKPVPLPIKSVQDYFIDPIMQKNILTQLQKTVKEEITEADLATITTLDLSKTEINTLLDIEQLPNLEVLNISDTNITTIPDTLLNNPHLTTIIANNITFDSDSAVKFELLKDKGVTIDFGIIKPIALETVDSVVIQSENFDENKGEDIMSKPLNTYIDLTSSNETLLSELESLEKRFGKTKESHLDLNAEGIFTDVIEDSVENEANVLIAGLNNDDKKIITMNVVESDEGEDEMAMKNSIEIIENKEKRNKIIVGASVAVAVSAAVVGGAVYYFTKKQNKSKKKSRFTFKIGE